MEVVRDDDKVKACGRRSEEEEKENVRIGRKGGEKKSKAGRKVN
jgi:hypothetical protein